MVGTGDVAQSPGAIKPCMEFQGLAIPPPTECETHAGGRRCWKRYPFTRR